MKSPQQKHPIRKMGQKSAVRIRSFAASSSSL